MNIRFTTIHSLLLCFCFSGLSAQVTPSIQWQGSFGGSENESAHWINQTLDGGYIITGYSSSSDYDVSLNNGGRDYWIVKLDSTGNLIWQKPLGGSGDEEAYSVAQSNSGYLVVGKSYSNNGDVTGNHGGNDIWVVKLDPYGSMEWQKSFGGSSADVGYSVQSTNDGGYIVAGESGSSDGDVLENHGEVDAWVVKLDSTGNLMWQKTYGGSGNEGFYSISVTSDAGYIAAGYSSSNDDDVSGNHGYDDCWVVRLDSQGEILWQKSLGGSQFEGAFSIEETSDSGYIVAGNSTSSDGDVTYHYGDQFNPDFWIVKLNTFGELMWQKTLGGSYEDYVGTVNETFDNGYLVTGQSASIDGDIENPIGGMDSWIVRLDASGNPTWQMSLGGTHGDGTTYGQQTLDSGFVITGWSNSIDGDVTGNHGLVDFWVVKLSPEITGIDNVDFSSSLISPNPVENLLTIDLGNQIPNTTLSLFNLIGEKVKEEKVTGKEVTMDVSSLPQGVYLVRTENGVVGKFVKE